MGILATIQSKVSSYQAEAAKLQAELDKLKNMGIDERAKYNNEYLVKQFNDLKTQLESLEDKYITELNALIVADRKAAMQEYALAYNIPANIASFLQVLIAQYQGAAQSSDSILAGRTKEILYAELLKHMENETAQAWAYAHAINTLYPGEKGITQVLAKTEQILIEQTGNTALTGANKRMLEVDLAEKTYKVEILRGKFVRLYNDAEKRRDAVSMMQYQGEIKKIDALKVELQKAG